MKPSAHTYSRDYEEYKLEVESKIDARVIITASVCLVAMVMLYLMQRARTSSRIDVIAVYRLLGISKINLVFIFAFEAFVSTVKYALPTILSVWLVILGISSIEIIDTVILYPFWAAALTFGIIVVFRTLSSVLPLVRMMRLPPAKLANRYDL